MKVVVDQDFVQSMIMASPDGCWLWTGSVMRGGYGKYGHCMAHRMSYEVFVGEIPDGLELDHLCRQTACVRPDHLEPVTPKENVRRSNGITGLNARKTTCQRGHPFDESNTIITSDGRRCRSCTKENQHRWYMDHQQELINRAHQRYHRMGPA